MVRRKEDTQRLPVRYRAGSSSAVWPTGPVPFHYPAPDYFGELLSRGEDH